MRWGALIAALPLFLSSADISGMTHCHLPSKPLWCGVSFEQVSWWEAVLHWDNMEQGGKFAPCRSRCRGLEPALSSLQESFCYSKVSCRFPTSVSWSNPSRVIIRKYKASATSSQLNGSPGCPAPSIVCSSQSSKANHCSVAADLNPCPLQCSEPVAIYTALIAMLKTLCWKLNYFKSIWVWCHMKFWFIIL